LVCRVVGVAAEETGVDVPAPHVDADRGDTSFRVEHVGRNAHELSMLLRRIRVIFLCSSAATWSSVAGSFSIRWRRAATTSSALRPAADAVELDTTATALDEVVAQVVALAGERGIR